MSTSRSDVAVQATYFDGQSALPVAALLSAEQGALLLRLPQGEQRWPLDQVRVSERLGNTPRLVSFAHGGHCEVTDHARFEELLQQLGMRSNWLDRWQHSLGWAALAVVLIVAAFFGGYRYLLPWGAQVLAVRVPEAALQRMSASTIDFLDRATLQPSTLSAERQQQLQASFAQFIGNTATAPHYRLLFRNSPAMGANAFALPDGTIVLLDGLVELAQNDAEIDAVLAHELGHVQRRHGVRMLLQASAVGLVMAWYVGDVSTLLAGAPAALLQAKYSRDMESEADAYAAQALQRNGQSGCVLAGMLGKLEHSHRKGAADNVALDYLASHPATRERMRALCPAS